MSANPGTIAWLKSATAATLEKESISIGRDIASTSLDPILPSNAHLSLVRTAIVALVMIIASTEAWAQGSCPSSPNYAPDFSSNQNCLALNDNATFVSDGTTVLELTSSTGTEEGSAWYLTPQIVVNGFTTTFQFQFTNPSSPPADGIAFLVQNYSTDAITITGGALAYGDDDVNMNPSQGEGIPSSVAIEFDTYQNPWDPAPVNGVDSHVAIQSCGTGPNTSHHNYLCNGTSGPNSTLGQPVSTENSGINFADGNVHTVTINYAPACSTCNPATVANIQVYVDSLNVYPNGIPVDLSTIASGTGTAYVGFTGSTGSEFETQNILNWTVGSTQPGTPVNPNNPQSLSQSTVVSNVTGEYWAFNFDYTTANNSGTLTIQPGTTPYVGSSGISPTDWASIVSGTAMADASCFISAIDPSVCVVNTMTCTTSANSNPEGLNCPQSTARNMLFNQQIDVAQNQNGIVNGVLTIPSGYAPGFAMGPDALVAGAQCTYPSGSPLATQLCPESVMTQLEDNTPKPGGTGTTTNSTYVFFCCEAEWATTPTIPLWNNTVTVSASFSSAPPPTPNPNTNNFQAAQGAFVTVGAEPHGTVLDTTYPLPAEENLTTFNGTAIPQCPALGVPPATPWSTQNPQPFSVNGTITSYDNNGTASPLSEGAYDAHYFSVDCDSFEELAFPATLNFSPGTPGTNMASFKIQPFNIDLTAPTISNVTLNPGSTVLYGSTLTAAVTCMDSVSNGVASGVSNCGGQATVPQSYPPLTTTPTVTVNLTLPTNVLGQQSYAVPGPIDQAGNAGIGTAIQYNVVPFGITPSTWNFGTLYLGAVVSQSFTVSNMGSTSVSIKRLNIPPPPDDFKITSNNCEKTLAAGASCNVTVTFSADWEDPLLPNGNSAYLTATDNAPGSPQTAHMYGTVINPQLALHPASLTFKTQKSDTTSAAETVKVINPGSSELSLSGLTISPSNFGLAAATTCTATTMLAPKGSCLLYITFSPSEPGSYTGSVTFTDNAQNSPQTLPLSGTGD